MAKIEVQITRLLRKPDRSISTYHRIGTLVEEYVDGNWGVRNVRDLAGGIKGMACSEATLRACQRLARHWKESTVTKADKAGLGYNATIRLLALDAAAIRLKRRRANGLLALRDCLIDQIGKKQINPAEAWQMVRDAADKARAKHDGYARCRLRDTKRACRSSLAGLIGRLEGVRPYVAADQGKRIDKMIRRAHWLTNQVQALRNRE